MSTTLTMHPEGRTNARTIISNFASLASVETKKFWALVKEENKSKNWSITPIKIEFRDGKIVENSKDVEKLVSLMDSWIEKEIQEADVEKLKADEEIVRTIYEWFSGSRKQLTKPLDDLKKNFTTLERQIKEQIEKIKQKQLELQEEEFKRREKVLREYINYSKHQQDELNEINIDIQSLMSDFIARKRKTQVLTEKGELKKAVKQEIDLKVKEILEPIFKERQKQKAKEQDLKRVALDLEGISTNSLFIDELNSSLSRLKKLRDMSDNLYPNAKDEAMAQIEAKIEIAEANIKRLEEKAKQDEEKKADEEILKEAKEITKPALKESIESLEEKLSKLRELRKKAKLAETIHKIDEIGIEIKNDLMRLKAIKLEQEQEKKTDAKNRQTTEYVPKWKIPLEEIEVIASITIEARDEKEAKEKAVEIFKKQLEFIELERI